MIAPSCFFWNISYARGASSAAGGAWRNRRRRADRRRASSGRCPAPSVHVGLAHPQAGSACRTIQHRQRVGHAAVDPLSEIVPPRRTSRWPCTGRSSGRHRPSISGPASASGSARRLVGELRDRRAVRLHADGVDDESGPRPSVRSRIASPDRRSSSVDHLDAVAAASASRSGTRSIPITRPAPDAGDPALIWPIGPSPKHGDCPAFGDRRVLDRLPGRGQHVGEEDEALVGGPRAP